MKEERRELWRKKKAIRDHNKRKQERKKHSLKEAIIKKGIKKTIEQPSVQRWARVEGGLK